MLDFELINLFNEKHLYSILEEYYKDFVYYIDIIYHGAFPDDIVNFKASKYVNKCQINLLLNDSCGHHRLVIDNHKCDLNEQFHMYVTFKYKSDVDHANLFLIGTEFNLAYLFDKYIQKRIKEKRKDIDKRAQDIRDRNEMIEQIKLDIAVMEEHLNHT